MKTFGKNIKLTVIETGIKTAKLFIDGILRSYDIDLEEIKEYASFYNPDLTFTIESGITNNKTTGLTIVISTTFEHSMLIDEGIVNPLDNDFLVIQKLGGHFDLTYDDRINYLLVIGGAIIKQVLYAHSSIKILSHIASIQDLNDTLPQDLNYHKKYDYLANEKIPVFDPRAQILMHRFIRKSELMNKTLGGSIETFIFFPPKFLGDPIFDSFEGRLSHLLFNIKNLRALEFGNIEKILSPNNCPFFDEINYFEERADYLSNNCWGLVNGVTTGNTIKFKTYFNPPLPFKKGIASINVKTGENIIIKADEQKTIEFHKNIKLIEGFCCFVILDAICELKKTYQ